MKRRRGLARAFYGGAIAGLAVTWMVPPTTGSFVLGVLLALLLGFCAEAGWEDTP